MLVPVASRPLYPRGKSPSYPFSGSWVDPRAGLGVLDKRKLLPPTGFGAPDPSASTLVSVPTGLPAAVGYKASESVGGK